MEQVPDTLAELFSCSDVETVLSELQGKILDLSAIVCIYVTRSGYVRFACTKMTCAELIGYLEKAKHDTIQVWEDDDVGDEEGSEDEDEDEADGDSCD